MKLFDWLSKEDFADPLDIDALIIAARDGRKLGAMEGYMSDGLHVIGTCEECQHFKTDACHKKIVWFDGSDMTGFIGMPPKDFGCIHFEAKGEK